MPINKCSKIWKKVINGILLSTLNSTFEFHIFNIDLAEGFKRFLARSNINGSL